MSDIARQVQEYLTQLKAEFEIITIDPALSDTVPFCEHYGFPLEQAANAILVASKRPGGHFGICMALGTTRLDVNHRVRDLMGVKRLSFASPETTTQITGMEIGAVTPFALPDDLSIYVDAQILAWPWVIVGGGDRKTKIKVNPEVFSRMESAQVVEGLAHPPPAGNA